MTATQTQTITFKHSINSGDLIASMAGIKKVCHELNSKAIIYQRLDLPARYYSGAIHPIKDEGGVQVCMNKNMFDMLYPLVVSQDYVEDFRIWQGEKVVVDIDKMRDECFCNLPYGAIQNWVGLVYPDMQTDLSKAWIDVAKVDNDLSDKAIINFTQRYRNDAIAYYFLRDYEDKLVFAGTRDEHELFTRKYNLIMPRLTITNFLELAQAIKSCKFFLGNQSFAWNVSEAMKVPRIVELCHFAQNCIHGIGKDSYGYFLQGHLEYFVKTLFEK